MELALRGNMAVATSSPWKYNTGSRWFSRFRGVISLRSGNWGSRITFKHKVYWLGTYDIEEEAAMAYDRACIKLQKGDAPLNFPVSVYTVAEMRFQGLYSNMEILEMIKEKTYALKLSEFLADESLARRLRSRISYRLLFQKELTQNDVTNVKGFHIPRDFAVQYFPPVAGGGSGAGRDERKWIQLTFFDKHNRSWTFRYSFWKSTQSFGFTKGWRQFIKMNALKARDLVVFYKCGLQGENEENTYYMIDVRRAGREINGGDAAPMEDIKLFGVCIGKRKRTEE